MAEAHGRHEARAASRRRLVVLIARDEASFDPLVNGLLDVGVTGATVLESRGLAAVVREDMPIFAGLAALLPTRTGSKVVLSLLDIEHVAAIRRFVENDLLPHERPIVIVLPVESVEGLGDG